MASFGYILRELRKSHKLTQTQLGEMFGLKCSTIGMYERGKRQPDPKTLIELAAFFGVSVDFLLGNTPLLFDSKRYATAFFRNAGFEQDDYLTPHEDAVIAAYRLQPDKQPIVDGVLGVLPEDEGVDLIHDRVAMHDSNVMPISEGNVAQLVRDAAFDGDIRISEATGSPEDAAEAKRIDDYHSDGF